MSLFDGTRPEITRNHSIDSPARWSLVGYATPPMPRPAPRARQICGDGIGEAPWVATTPEASCPGMRVWWGRPGPAERPETSHTEIEIAIPCDDAAVEISYHTATGRAIRATATGHHVSIIPAGQAHAVAWRRTANLVVVFLEPSVLGGAAEEGPANGAPQILEHYAQIDPFVRQLGLSLRDDCQLGCRPDKLYLGSVACVLAKHLLQHYSAARRNAARPGGLPKHLLRRAVEFIHANLAHDLTLDDIAQAVGLSPFYFARLFKQATGLGPHRYVMHSRVERAKELLRLTERPIVDVALATGFADQSHLTEVFRRLTGATPNVFRQQRRA